MRRRPLLALLLPLALPVLAEDPPRLADLGFLSGRWEGELTMVRDGQPGPDRPQRFEASYSSVDGGALLSTSKCYESDGSVEFFEFELFHELAGQVVLNPLPGGRPAAQFTLVALDRAARRASFESPRNDWPKRLVYERLDEDRLRIVASGPQEGRPFELRLELRRVTKP